MPSETEKPIIEIENLDFVYNQGLPNEAVALNGINLRIYPHEYVVVFGPSGCGKSTLLYSIAGFQKPTSGKIIIGGDDLGSLGKKEEVEFHRRKIGMVFQTFFLIPTLRVLDNICLPKVFLGADPGERKQAGKELLQRFGISEHEDKFPAELSGGQKQRVAIARSLMNNPDIILADEPVGNLDSKSAFNVMSILKELNEKDKKTVILVTHDPNHLNFGSKVVYMSDGKITKIEEVVERRRTVLKGENETLVKKETLMPEIQMLMKSFRNFSPTQLGMLLIPFKAQEFLSHILFHMPDDQIVSARTKLQEVISGRMSLADFEKILDEDESRGGIGWDKRTVSRIVKGMKNILDQTSRIDSRDTENSAKGLTDYLMNCLKLEFSLEQKTKFIQIVKMRLDNELSIVEFRMALDRPEKRGGLGLDSRTAKKIARELEIILLAKFAS